MEDATDHRLTLEQAIDIAKETCRGLEFAHSRGIVHRDLKPGNVWLTVNGGAKIGKPGIAKIQEWLGHAKPFEFEKVICHNTCK